MITRSEMLTIPQLLDALRETAPPEGGVLSVYLDTSPNRIRGQSYLLSYRAGCKAVRSQVDPWDRNALEALIARAEAFITNQLDPAHPGLALFVAEQENYLFAAGLPRRPSDAVVWSTRPHIEPLVAVLDDFERLAVVVFDKERTRLFSIFLGQIEEKQEFHDEVPGKQATGGWFGLAQTRYARHHEDHVLRHAKRTAAALTELLRAHPFSRLFIGGPDEAVAVLRTQLPRSLRERIARRSVSRASPAMSACSRLPCRPPRPSSARRR